MNKNSKKFEFLASSLRNDIFKGSFNPGDKLPTFQQMERKYTASRGVLQLAIEHLKQTGFVTSRDRHGLFVSNNPPHLQRYALVFANKRNEDMTRFDIALINAVNQLNELDSGAQCVIFDGLCNKYTRAQVLQDLEYEIANHLFAGVIFLPGTFDLLSRKLFANEKLGKILVFAHENYKQAPIVTTDGLNMITRTFDYFKKQNRKRVAVLYMADATIKLEEEDFLRYGFEYKPQWILNIGRSHPETVERIIPLLMDYSHDQRPDAIFIADDNLVEYSVSSIISTGLQIGKDIDIVGHCNWPCPTPSMAPIKRIGFHVEDLLKRSIYSIGQQRNGIVTEMETVLPALFEEEL